MIARPFCAEPDSWVEGRGDQVADQRRDEVHDADDEHAGEQHREVLHLCGRQREEADPGIAEELLDRHDAAEQVADLRRDDRDRREQAVPDDVARQDLRLGSPFSVAVLV